MKRIMFVCNGNICRSVMAEYMFKDMITKVGQDKDYYICSAGIVAYSGQTAIEKTVKNVKEQTGLDLSEHMATNINDANVYGMDLILCMTGAQKLQLQNRYKEIASKIYTLKEYVIYDNADNKDIDIEDPFDGTDEVFIECINQIKTSLHKLIKILE